MLVGCVCGGRKQTNRNSLVVRVAEGGTGCRLEDPGASLGTLIWIYYRYVFIGTRCPISGGSLV